jgi:hypothetical protein
MVTVVTAHIPQQPQQQQVMTNQENDIPYS